MNPDNNDPTDNTTVPPVTDPVSGADDTSVVTPSVMPTEPAADSSTPQPDVVSPSPEVSGEPVLPPSPEVNADADMASEDTTTLGDLAQNLETSEPAPGPVETPAEPSSEAAPVEPSDGSEQTPSA